MVAIYMGFELYSFPHVLKVDFIEINLIILDLLYNKNSNTLFLFRISGEVSIETIEIVRHLDLGERNWLDVTKAFIISWFCPLSDLGTF